MVAGYVHCPLRVQVLAVGRKEAAIEVLPFGARLPVVNILGDYHLDVVLRTRASGSGPGQTALAAGSLQDSQQDRVECGCTVTLMAECLMAPCLMVSVGAPCKTRGHFCMKGQFEKVVEHRRREYRGLLTPASLSLLWAS